ncbi:MAG: hypothetical protein QM802_01225 [Agriterribacter sp.]
MRLTLPEKLHYTLRIASAMCFIGHGAFGIITKQVWCNYFAVFGIEQKLAYTLMPVVGMVDILLGIILIFYPVRAVAAWLVGWGLLTAMLRPLSGEPFAEFIERAGNYGAPFIFLVLHGTTKNWFTRIVPVKAIDEKKINAVIRWLELIGFMILLGHGWLNVILKQGLLNQYSALGFTNPVQVAQIVGVLEIIAAISIVIKPIRALIFLLFVWKMISELFYPHYGLFEWIERGGSYGVLFALWLSLRETTLKNREIPRLFNYFKKAI